MQPENQNNNQMQVANPRVKKIEDFLLNPDKVIFESIEELSSAIETIIKMFEGVDLSTLEQLKGLDGKNPQRGVDYMTEDDLKAIEAFIMSKVPVVGEQVPSVDQVRTFINDAVAKLPLQRGEKGDTFTFDDLTEEQKAQLKGKDGNIETTESILAKIRAAGKNQGLKIRDIRGLENVIKQIIDSFENLDESVKQSLSKLSFNVPSGINDGGSGGSGLTSEQIQDLVASMFTSTTHSGCTVAYDDTLGTLTITVSGGGGGSLTEEEVEDIVNGLIVPGAGISASYNDVANTLTIALTGESFTTAMKNKVDFITVTQPIDLDAIEARVNSLDAVVSLKGLWDASTGVFPGAGSAQAGDSFIVSVDGVVGGVDFKANDRIIAITDNASTSVYATNWHKADYTDAVLSVDGQVGAINLSAILSAKADDTTPVDADNINILDSTAGNVLKKLSLTNLKAFLKTYFDTLYQPLSAILTGLAAMGTGTGSVHQTAAATFVKRVLTGTTNLITITNGDGVAGNPTFTVGNLVVQTTATQTLTNKRVNPRVATIASGATITPAGDTTDMAIVTALAINTTIAAPTGTPVDGQKMIIRITSDATPRTIAWNAIYRAVGITLPTTTVASKTFYVGLVYNSLATKWDAIAYALEA